MNWCTIIQGVASKHKHLPTITEAEAARAFAKLWSRHLHASCGIAELRQSSMECIFILWAFVSLEVDLTVEQKAPSAPRLFPVEVSSSAQSLTSLCGSSKTPAKQTRYVKHAFRLLLSSWGEGMRSSWDKFSSPLFISAVADCSLFWMTHGWIASATWMWVCVAVWGKHQGVQYAVNLTGTHHVSLLNIFPCACLHCKLLRTMQPVWASTIQCSAVWPGVSWVDPRGTESRYASDILTPLTASKEGAYGKQWPTWEAPKDPTDPIFQTL